MEGQTHQSQKEIEALKYQLTRSKKSAKIRDDLWSKSVDSLSEGIRCIQKFKDTVQFIVSAEGTSLDADLAMEYITEARSEFFSSFETNLANLNEREAKAFHRAKNISLSVENQIKSSLHDVDIASALSEEDVGELLRQRSDLTDAQQVLRDFRIERLTKRISDEGIKL